MAQEVNLLDPLGIAKAVRGQVNQMVIQAKLPPLPEMPAIKVNMAGFPLLNQFNPVLNRPGLSRSDRAG
ncbi:hypothetical protein LCGC14_1475510 [marine sediment metagenome]|uniref:Uncharacterized protein n=1 Tax=marine sediment metagenome TaxID=412755 RepID=A0A0F9JX23_9ZZZZ